MEFLREIDSPVPAPLRVAADVTLTRRVLELTRAARAGGAGLEGAERDLEEAIRLVRRLDAHLHTTAVQREVEALLRAHFTELLSGAGPLHAAAGLVRVLSLSRRLGLELDLWSGQNSLWAWAGSTRVILDRALTAQLARAYWFDEETLLRRAGHPASES